MNTQKQTHDTQIFSAKVEILISSGLGENGTEDFGLRTSDKRYDQTRYEVLALVMNQIGFTNRAGKPLNRLTPHSPHSVLHSPDETNPRIDGPCGPPVPVTRIGWRAQVCGLGETGRSSIQEVLRFSLYGEDHG